MAERVLVGLELGGRRAFASALDYPGWCRVARDEPGAIGRLDDYRDRFARVAGRAGIELPKDPIFEVVERVTGDATTDFGAPSQAFQHERRPLTREAAERLASFLGAAWAELSAVAAQSPEELTKGPRGGGRDRTKMLDHVREAEYAYARKIGIRLTSKKATWDELHAAITGAVAGALGGVTEDGGWPPAYFTRRAAWHVLDHAWEMEDRRPS